MAAHSTDDRSFSTEGAFEFPMPLALASGGSDVAGSSEIPDTVYSEGSSASDRPPAPPTPTTVPQGRPPVTPKNNLNQPETPPNGRPSPVPSFRSTRTGGSENHLDNRNSQFAASSSRLDMEASKGASEIATPTVFDEIAVAMDGIAQVIRTPIIDITVVRAHLDHVWGMLVQIITDPTSPITVWKISCLQLSNSFTDIVGSVEGMAESSGSQVRGASVPRSLVTATDEQKDEVCERIHSFLQHLGELELVVGPETCRSSLPLESVAESVAEVFGRTPQESPQVLSALIITVMLPCLAQIVVTTAISRLLLLLPVVLVLVLGSLLLVVGGRGSSSSSTVFSTIVSVVSPIATFVVSLVWEENTDAADWLVMEAVLVGQVAVFLPVIRSTAGRVSAAVTLIGVAIAVMIAKPEPYETNTGVHILLLFGGALVALVGGLQPVPAPCPPRPALYRGVGDPVLAPAPTENPLSGNVTASFPASLASVPAVGPEEKFQLVPSNTPGVFKVGLGDDGSPMPLALKNIEDAVHKPLLVLVADGTDVVLQCTDRFASLAGTNVAGVIGKSVWKFFEPPTSGKKRSSMATRTTGSMQKLRNKTSNAVHVNPMIFTDTFSVVVVSPEVTPLDIQWMFSAIRGPTEELLRVSHLGPTSPQQSQQNSMQHDVSGAVAMPGLNSSLLRGNASGVSLPSMSAPQPVFPAVASQLQTVLQAIDNVDRRGLGLLMGSVESVPLLPLLESAAAKSGAALVLKEGFAVSVGVHTEALARFLYEVLRVVRDPNTGSVGARMFPKTDASVAIEFFVTNEIAVGVFLPGMRSKTSSDRSSMALQPDSATSELGGGVADLANPLGSLSSAGRSTASIPQFTPDPYKFANHLKRLAAEGGFHHRFEQNLNVLQVELPVMTAANVAPTETPEVQESSNLQPSGRNNDGVDTVLLIEPRPRVAMQLCAFFWSRSICVRHVSKVSDLVLSAHMGYACVVLPLRSITDAVVTKFKASMPRALIVATATANISNTQARAQHSAVDAVLPLTKSAPERFERVAQEIAYRGELGPALRDPTECSIGTIAVQGRLGQGAAGAVYRVNCDDGALCALKVIRIMDAGQAAATEEREREKAAVHLRHAHLVSTFHAEICPANDPELAHLPFGEGEGTLIMTWLELCTKTTLRERVAEKRFSDYEAASATSQIVRALQHLHKHGLFAGDLKASNVLLSRTGEYKLADYCSLEDTPNWQAPELLHNVVPRSELVNRQKADIWALGATMLELMHGKDFVPFGPQLEWMLASADIANGKIKGNFFRIPDGIGPDWSDFTTQCLRPNPQQRPTAAELLQHSFLTLASPEDNHEPTRTSTDGGGGGGASTFNWSVDNTSIAGEVTMDLGGAGSAYNSQGSNSRGSVHLPASLYAGARGKR